MSATLEFLDYSCSRSWYVLHVQLQYFLGGPERWQMGRKSPWSPANGNCMSTRGATDNFGGNWTRGTVVTGTHLPKHRWNCHVKTLNQVWENSVWIGRFGSVWGSHNSTWPHRRPSLCRVKLPSSVDRRGFNVVTLDPDTQHIVSAT